MPGSAGKGKGVNMNGQYIYCIIESNHQKDFGPLGIGEGEPELTTVCYNDISAVISSCSVKEFVVSRENTMKHERAIEEVLKEHPVLPVRFSTIANSKEQIVKKVLVPRYEEFKDLLSWMRDKQEIGIRARWVNMDLVFKEILEENERIKELKERIAAKTPEETYYDRIDLGKMIEAKLKEKKKEEKDRIVDALKEKAEDYKINDVYGDEMILNSAFLVKKEKEEDFFSSVSDLQNEYDERVQLKYVTGSPPFNFVNLVIKL